MSVFESLVNVIAPPTCIACGEEGLAMCDTCRTSVILPFGERCWRCNKLTINGSTCDSCRSFGGPTNVWISSEYFEDSRELVKAFKFKHLRPSAKVMAQLMVETLQQRISQKDFGRKDYIIVAVPSSPERIRSRGFDHADLLAKEISRILGCRKASAIKRLGNLHQIGADRTTRLKQPKGQFIVRTNNIVKNRNVLLIDDVVTTGATLRECAKQLRAAGAKKVDALVFAKRI